MPERWSEADLDELAREELSGQEVHEIVKRLSLAEFQWGDNPTIKDVAEAAEVDPFAVAQVLREIRQDNLDEVFGDRLDEHARRLEEHAAELRQLRHDARNQEPRLYGTGDELREGHLSARRFGASVVIVCLAIFLVVLIALLTVLRPMSAPPSLDTLPPRSVSVKMEGGAEYFLDEKYAEWVELPNGMRRAPTAEEKASYRVLLLGELAREVDGSAGR